MSMFTDPEHDYISIVSTGPRPEDILIKSSTGRDLGYIQSARWEGGIGSYARLEITSIVKAATLQAMTNDTTLRIIPHPEYHPFHYVYDWYRYRLLSLFRRKPSFSLPITD